MKHPQPSNEVHDGYVRCTFRLFQHTGSNSEEEDRILQETEHLPDYRFYHEP